MAELRKLSLQRRINLLTELMEENRASEKDASVENSQLGGQRKKLQKELGKILSKEQSVADKATHEASKKKDAEAERKIQMITDNMSEATDMVNKSEEKIASAKKHIAHYTDIVNESEAKVKCAKKHIEHSKEMIERIKAGDHVEIIDPENMGLGDILSMIHQAINEHR